MYHYQYDLTHPTLKIMPTIPLSHLLHGKPQVEYFCVSLEHVVRRHDAHEVHALLLRALQGANSIGIFVSINCTKWPNRLYTRFCKMISASSTGVAAYYPSATAKKEELSEKECTIIMYVPFGHLVKGPWFEEGPSTIQRYLLNFFPGSRRRAPPSWGCSRRPSAWRRPPPPRQPRRGRPTPARSRSDRPRRRNRHRHRRRWHNCHRHFDSGIYILLIFNTRKCSGIAHQWL